MTYSDISMFIKMFRIKNEEPSYFCAAETECIIDEKEALYLEKEQDKWIKYFSKGSCCD